jgi:ABC-type lipoprotein release transport system permease subunit
VKVATPRLIATGILISGDSSTGVQLIGIDPSSPANDPYRNGLLEGSFVEPGDRDGILIGRRLAEKFKLKAGDTALVNVNTSNGDIAEQLVTIRGVYSTKVPGLDDGVAFMSLEKVQALTQTENHASTIFILLDDMAATDRVKSQMQTQQYKILTYVDTNELVSQWESFAGAYMVLMYLIVLGVTATVVVNALVMSVFERTREIGILSAIGMRSSNIMGMFLLESMLLSIGGILIGFTLGALFIWYATEVGFYIGSMGVTGIAIGETIYADFALKDGVSLTITALVVTLLASFYPAVMAARMQPVEALHGGKQA